MCSVTANSGQVHRAIETLIPDFVNATERVNSVTVCHSFLEHLEFRLVAELKKIVGGAESDQADLEKSAAIMEHVKVVAAPRIEPFPEIR
jgi:hypothetical protein